MSSSASSESDAESEDEKETEEKQEKVKNQNLCKKIQRSKYNVVKNVHSFPYPLPPSC